MKEPLLTYDSGALEALVEGSLAKGGILSNKIDSFSILFLCPPLKNTKSDIELTLKFQNNDSLSLFFQKECDTAGDISEFDLLYTIYWVFLFLFLISICVIFYYYIKRNNIAVDEILSTMWNKCKLCFGFIVHKVQGLISKTKKSESQLINYGESTYEENEIVDMKIKTATVENKKDYKYNMFTTDYGGI